MLGSRRALACGLVVAWLAAAPAAGAQEPQDLVVQSTTSVRDSGLLEQVIVPGLPARSIPQWTLKVVAVGTGQAITNARAGQGDVLITHAPALEAQFVADGFSLEPAGRTIMWNDFVIVGPPGDPAGVAAAARHDAAAAFEAIAAAGAAGRATFVSRGDNSGTNTKEKDIWKLTSVARNARQRADERRHGEPVLVHEGRARDGGHAAPHPAVPVGRRLLHDHRPRHAPAADLQRRDHRAADRDGRAGRGRARRLGADDQPVPRLCAQPGQGPGRQDGGRARVPGLPHLARLPGPARELPDDGAARVLPGSVPGRVARRAGRRGRSPPGARSCCAGRSPRRCRARAPLDGARVRLSRFTSPLTARTLGSAAHRRATGRSGSAGSPTAAAACSSPRARFRDLSPLRRALGRVRVRAAVRLREPRVRGGAVVSCRGRAWPATGRRRARLIVLARPAAGGRFQEVRRLRLRSGGNRFRLGATLAPGRWDVRVRYVDRGIVEAGRSARRSVAVG